MMLTEDLQKQVRKFYVGPSQDFLQWLKSFDPDNIYNVKKYKKYLVTTKPLVFIYHFLNLILDEMEKTALAILDEMATSGGPDSE
jgi:hypothetical protein